MQALPVAHRMDDEELLWRASFISLRDPERRAGARKVAFLFSFTDRLVFAPLWARFLGGHQGRFSVYLHGTKATVEDKGSLPPVFQDRFVPVEVSAPPVCRTQRKPQPVLLPPLLGPLPP